VRVRQTVAVVFNERCFHVRNVVRGFGHLAARAVVLLFVALLGELSVGAGRNIGGASVVLLAVLGLARAILVEAVVTSVEGG